MNKQKNFLKNPIKKIAKIILKMSFISIAAVLALITWLSLDDDSIKTYETPPTEIIKIDPVSFEIGFDVTKPNKLDVKFEVRRRNSYTFSWVFHTFEAEKKKEIAFVKNLKSFFPSKPEYPTAEERVDRKRVLGLIKKIAEVELKKSKKIQQRAVIIPNRFELFIVESSGERLVWDSEMERIRNEKIGSVQNMGYGGYDILVHFAGPILEPGIYHFTLDVPKGVVEFTGTEVSVSINERNSK